MIGSAFAQAWPARQIRMVIPYPPGGPTDIVGRIVAQQLSERLGHPVVVDNKPGASGMIGADIVAKSAADGYTLLTNASIHVINPSLYKKPAYDAIRDFAPVSLIANVPLVLVAAPSQGLATVQDVIAAAKSRPINFASSGNAAAPHLAGVPGYDISTWYGVWAPAGTPREILAKVSGEIAKIVRTPQVHERLASLGAEPVGNTPEEFAAYNQSELAKWAKIVQASGARVD